MAESKLRAGILKVLKHMDTRVEVWKRGDGDVALQRAIEAEHCRRALVIELGRVGIKATKTPAGWIIEEA